MHVSLTVVTFTNFTIFGNRARQDNRWPDTSDHSLVTNDTCDHRHL